MDWMHAALVALEQGQDLKTFVGGCHPDNRAKARKGYKQMQVQIRYGNECPKRSAGKPNKEYRNSGSDNARPVPGTKPEVADGLFMDLKGSESAEKPLIK